MAPHELLPFPLSPGPVSDMKQSWVPLILRNLLTPYWGSVIGLSCVTGFGGRPKGPSPASVTCLWGRGGLSLPICHLPGGAFVGQIFRNRNAP